MYTYVVDSIADVGGKLTKKTVEQHGQFSGSFGQTVTKVFACNVANLEVHTTLYNHPDNSEAVHKVVKLLKSENLFHNIPGRCHKSYPDFVYKEGCLKPDKYRAKLIAHSKKLDRKLHLRKRFQ